MYSKIQHRWRGKDHHFRDDREFAKGTIGVSTKERSSNCNESRSELSSQCRVDWRTNCTSDVLLGTRSDNAVFRTFSCKFEHPAALESDLCRLRCKSQSAAIFVAKK